MNDIFYSIISGANIVVGSLMLTLLIFGPVQQWTKNQKTGFFLMALGLIGQAAYVFSGLNLSDPIWDQLWSFKDIGMWFFTVSLINQWIDRGNK